MEIICSLCGRVKSEDSSAAAGHISHGYCDDCKDAMRRALHHERVEFEFWSPEDVRDKAIMNILDVGAREIRVQIAQGRTCRGVVRG